MSAWAQPSVADVQKLADLAEAEPERLRAFNEAQAVDLMWLEETIARRAPPVGA